jgi:hypothetical protein
MERKGYAGPPTTLSDTYYRVRLCMVMKASMALLALIQHDMKWLSELSSVLGSHNSNIDIVARAEVGTTNWEGKRER